MPNPRPEYKIIHIQACEPKPSTTNPNQSILQFEIFHFLRRCVPSKILDSEDYDPVTLNRITRTVMEMDTSAVLLGNSEGGVFKDMSPALSSLDIPERCHVGIVERISHAAVKEQAIAAKLVNVNLDVKIGGVTTEYKEDDVEVADVEKQNQESMMLAAKSCIEALEENLHL